MNVYILKIWVLEQNIQSEGTPYVNLNSFCEHMAHKMACVWCCVVWRGVVWCSVVWCVEGWGGWWAVSGVVWCGVVYGVVNMPRSGETCRGPRMSSLLREYQTLHVESAPRMTVQPPTAPPPGKA